MHDQILDDTPQPPTKLAVKIDFLRQEKQNLDESVRQLTDNIQIYKRIIEQLIESQGEKKQNRSDQITNRIVLEMNILNDRQTTRIEKLMEQVNSLKCALLLKDQIMEEQDIENQTVLKGYEDKILELRRAIQDKQYAIQEKENTKSSSRSEDRGKKDYISDSISDMMDPKQQFMKVTSELDEVMDVLKKLTIQNNELRRKNKDLNQDINEKNYKLSKLQAVLKSNVPFQTARSLYLNNRPSISEEKIIFKPKKTVPKGRSSDKNEIGTKDQPNFTKKRPSKIAMANYFQEGSYVKNESMSYLRQLLFKQKKITEQLTKALNQLTNNYTSLANSNKLLAQSNVNYQAKRAKLQAELNLYKKKNQDLLSIVMKRKVKLNRSYGQLPTDQVLRQSKHEQEIQHNAFQMAECLKSMKNEIQHATNSLARIATRGFFRRVQENRRAISYSCPIDYVPKQQLDNVQQFIKKQQQKLRKQEKQKDDTPFLSDFSMIKPQKQPITYTQYAFKKRKLISDSFIQISEQILIH